MNGLNLYGECDANIPYTQPLGAMDTTYDASDPQDVTTTFIMRNDLQGSTYWLQSRLLESLTNNKTQYLSSWWFQPISKIISQNRNLPQVGVNIKIAGNHHLVIIFTTQMPYKQICPNDSPLNTWSIEITMINRCFQKGLNSKSTPKKLDVFVWCLEKVPKNIIPKNGALIILHHGRNPLKNITNKNQIQENHHLGVSENGGTPKSSIFIGFSIINHPFWGTPIFGNTHLSTTKTAPHLPRRMLNLALRFIGKCWYPWDGAPWQSTPYTPYIVVFIGYIPF